MRIALLAYDGMDLMDFAGPYEVLHTANRLLRRAARPAAFELTTCSVSGGAVTCYGGVQVVPGAAVEAVAATGPDVVIVPGAIEVAGVLADTAVAAAVATLSAAAGTTASVCTGAFLLGAAGVLAGHRWTTHWEDLPDLARDHAGGVRARVVASGPLLTAGGVACGLDLALTLVERGTDSALARLTARQIDYPWDSYGAADGGRDPVVVTREVAADPARVYRLWTTEEGIRAFLDTEAVIEPRIGGRYEFRFLADQPDGYRGGEGCRIIALEPGRLLVFTWNSPPGMPTRGTHTWVVLTLTPTPAGTQVRLAQWGHGAGPEWDANREYFTAAWNRVLAALAAWAAAS